MSEVASASATPSEEGVADRLHSAAIHLLRTLRMQDDASGIGPARLSALSILVFAGPRPLCELARLEQVRPPTMSRVVDGLEKAGLARRRVDPADRRSVQIHATPKGIKLLQDARKRRVRDLTNRLAGLSDEERGHLRNAASIIEKVL